jgi:hypothetical protein
MKNNQKKIFCLIVSCLLSSILLAKESPITISSSVDKSRITIGDLFTYTVSVTHDKDIDIEMPGLGVNLGQFEIRDYEVYDPKKEKQKVISKVDYILSTFFTGDFEIPPLTIKYKTLKDTVFNTLSTEKINIIVESVKASEKGDIIDIKSPLLIPKNLWYLLRWFVLGGGILFICFLAILIYKRKKAGKGLLPVKEIPPRPPHEIALEALDKLKTSDLLTLGEVKQFYIEISEIIRQYIGGRYFVVAMEMTTTDVLLGLKTSNINNDEFELFKIFLNRCDLVKFAKYIPLNEEHQEIIELAYTTINKTKVVLEVNNEEIKSVNETGDIEEEPEETVTENFETITSMTSNDKGNKSEKSIDSESQEVIF